MRTKIQTVLSGVLCFILSFMLWQNAFLSVACKADPATMEVFGYDMTITDGNQEFLFYDPGNPHTGFSYKGVSYDAKTNTLKLSKADAPFLEIRFPGMVQTSNPPLTIANEGDSRIGNLLIENTASVSFTGSGSLTINAPYTGKIKANAQELTVTNSYPGNYNDECWGAGIVMRAGQTAPALSIGKDLTLTVHGSSNTGNVIAGETGDLAAGCIRFITESETKPVWQEAGLIKCDSEAVPALVWEKADTETPNPEFVSVDDTTVCIPYDSLYVGKNASGTFTVSENNLYVKNNSSYYAIRKNETTPGWSVSAQAAPVDSDSVSQNSLQALSFAEGFPYDSDTGLLTLNQPAASDSECNSLLCKDGKDYVCFLNANLYTAAVMSAAGISSSADAYSYALYENGSLSEMPHPIADVNDPIGAMVKSGFACRTNYQRAVTLKNQKQTFRPKSVDQKDTSGGQKQPADNTVKVGETVQKSNGAFTLTQDKNGKLQATFSSNESTEAKKTVTIPASVQINGQSVPVTAIADNAFKGDSSLTTLKFKGKNLKKVGNNAFSKCPSLKKAALPDSVTELGKGAFDGDKNLSDLTVNGNNLKKVGKNALRGIKKNAKVTIKAKNKSQYQKTVKMLKKAGNKKLKCKFKKSKK